jgi:hypothetical protein
MIGAFLQVAYGPQLGMRTRDRHVDELEAEFAFRSMG